MFWDVDILYSPAAESTGVIYYLKDTSWVLYFLRTNSAHVIEGECLLIARCSTYKLWHLCPIEQH